MCAVVISGYFVGNIIVSQENNTDKTCCAPNPNRSSGDSVGSSELRSEIDDRTMSSPGVADTEPAPKVISPKNPKGTKVIKTGTLDVTVKRGSLSESIDDVVALLPDSGYVESSSRSTREATVTVRIPTEKLDSTLVALRKIGDVTGESLDSDDRSFEYVDLQARLTIMQEREVVLRDLLRQSKTVSDSQNIENQLFFLREQIESTLGQINLLNDQVSLSTLTIELTEKGVKKDTPKDQTMIGKAWDQSAKSLLTTFGGIMIVISALLPLIVVVALVYIPIRVSLKRKKGSTTVTHSGDKE